METKKLGVKICFSSKVDRKDLLFRVVEDELFGFKPELMEIDYVERDYNKERAKELIEYSEKNTGITFTDNSGNYDFFISFSAIITPPLTIILTTNNPKEFNYDLFIGHFAKEEHFVSAFVYDHDDVKWESETSISEYELNEIDHSKILKTTDEWGDLVIDVSENHGRETLLNETWLMASPIMWFSKVFFNLAGIVEEMWFRSNNELFDCHHVNKNVVRITLFEDIFSSKENRELQKEFRSFGNFELIEKNLYPY